MQNSTNFPLPKNFDNPVSHHAFRHHGKKHPHLFSSSPSESVYVPTTDYNGSDIGSFGPGTRSRASANDNSTSASAAAAPTDNTNNTCYSTNQVLIVIGITCFVNFTFISLIMVFVQCVGASRKNKRKDEEPEDEGMDYENSDIEGNWEYSRLRLASLPDNVITQSFTEKYLSSKMASLKNSYYENNCFSKSASTAYSRISETEITDSDEDCHYPSSPCANARFPSSVNRYNCSLDSRRRNYFKLPTDDLTFYRIDRHCHS